MHFVELHDIVEKYKAWYDAHYRPEKHNNRMIRISFQRRSLLSDNIVKKNGEYLLEGWRAINTNESLPEDAILFINTLQDFEIQERKENKKNTSYTPTHETVDRYYERVCHEALIMNNEKVDHCDPKIAPYPP